jgi:hypothetical protein
MSQKLISNWEYTKQQSNYHFDVDKVDLPGHLYQVLGRFCPTWQAELQSMLEISKPMTWDNRKKTNGRNEVSAMIDQEEYDIIQGWGDPKMVLIDTIDNFSHFPSMQKIINFFGTELPKARIHIQKTGQVFNRHIDKLAPIYPDQDPERIVKFIVNLQDWEPGHFYLYGNDVYDRWKAGDFHVFDWKNVPHATANASHIPRFSLTVTGLRTDVTDNLLKSTEFTVFSL